MITFTGNRLKTPSKRRLNCSIHPFSAWDAESRWRPRSADSWARWPEFQNIGHSFVLPRWEYPNRRSKHDSRCGGAIRCNFWNAWLWAATEPQRSRPRAHVAGPPRARHGRLRSLRRRRLPNSDCPTGASKPDRGAECRKSCRARPGASGEPRQTRNPWRTRWTSTTFGAPILRVGFARRTDDAAIP